MSTFLQLVESLLIDQEAKAGYARNPQGFLADRGFDRFDEADVAEALRFSADAMPATVAAQIDSAVGLQSVADVDLDALGLTLDRPPIETVDDFGHDTDLDVIDPLGNDPADSIDEIADVEPVHASTEPLVERAAEPVEDPAESEVEPLEPDDVLVEDAIGPESEIADPQFDWADETDLDDLDDSTDFDLDGLT